MGCAHEDNAARGQSDLSKCWFAFAITSYQHLFDDQTAHTVCDEDDATTGHQLVTQVLRQCVRMVSQTALTGSFQEANNISIVPEGKDACVRECSR